MKDTIFKVAMLTMMAAFMALYLLEPRVEQGEAAALRVQNQTLQAQVDTYNKELTLERLTPQEMRKLCQPLMDASVEMDRRNR